VHRNKFPYNKTNQMHQFPKFTPAWKPTYLGQFLCPSSGVYSLYTRQEFSSRSICSCSKAVYKPVWHIPVPSAQWINSWLWAEELPETCRISCRSKFGKFVRLFGFIIKKLIVVFDCIYRYLWFYQHKGAISPETHIWWTFGTYSM